MAVDDELPLPQANELLGLSAATDGSVPAEDDDDETADVD
jgi:hypothetical protein